MPRRYLASLAVMLTALTFATPSPAQKKSVRPGINKSFQNPNVKSFIKRFERDGREPYDRRKEIVKACHLKPGMTVADVGSGTGLFTRLFSDAVGPTGKVYAVDIAKSFLKHIDETAKAEKRSNITTVLCTQQTTNLPPNSLDVAFICDVYHHFEFPHKSMRSIHRALKPGGQVILIDFHRIEGKSSKFVLGHVRAGKDVFVGEVKKAGFRVVEDRKDTLKENYFVRFAKVADATTPKK
jgi:ubiquinone/menaquinone biosynthesis C-methylase UbiE